MISCLSALISLDVLGLITQAFIDRRKRNIEENIDVSPEDNNNILFFALQQCTQCGHFHREYVQQNRGRLTPRSLYQVELDICMNCAILRVNADNVIAQPMDRNLPEPDAEYEPNKWCQYTEPDIEVEPDVCF